MHKAAVAAEIGRDAFCIIAVVLHTEDAARYSGPVRFFNSQLMETLGFSKWDAFDRARARAIESGWLKYSGDGKRSAGRYFVTIPDGFGDITDAVIEDATCTVVNAQNGYKQGYDDGYKHGYNQGIKGGAIRVQTGDKQGEPYSPIPIPSPEYSPGSEILIPESMNTPEIIRLVGKWFHHLRAKDKHEKVPDENSPQEESFWQQIAKMGPERFRDAVVRSMAEGWVTFREDRGGASSPAKASHSHEFIQALAVCRQFPDDWRKREAALPQDIAKAVKLTGSAQFLAAKNDWDLKTVAQIFDQHLKAIREGVVSK
jgi:hypothetical protein